MGEIDTSVTIEMPTQKDYEVMKTILKGIIDPNDTRFGASIDFHDALKQIGMDFEGYVDENHMVDLAKALDLYATENNEDNEKTLIGAIDSIYDLDNEQIKDVTQNLRSLSQQDLNNLSFVIDGTSVFTNGGDDACFLISRRNCTLYLQEGYIDNSWIDDEDENYEDDYHEPIWGEEHPISEYKYSNVISKAGPGDSLNTTFKGKTYLLLDLASDDNSKLEGIISSKRGKAIKYTSVNDVAETDIDYCIFNDNLDGNMEKYFLHDITINGKEIRTVPASLFLQIYG